MATSKVRADARVSVAERVARLSRHGVSVVLATSRRADSLHRRYDTLVFRVQRDRPVDDDAGDADATPTSALLLDTLRAWRRLSARDGMAFDENTAFWLDALGESQRADRVHPLGVACAAAAFPRVVLDWYFRTGSGARRAAPVAMQRELALLRDRLLNMFHSQDEDVSQADDDDEEEDDVLAPIQCAVRVRLRQTVTATRCLLEHVAAQAVRYVSSEKQGPRHLEWTGIEVLGRHRKEHFNQGLDADAMALLTSALGTVPSSMRVDVLCPEHDWRYRLYYPARSHSSVAVPFVRRAFGFSQDNTTGRLRVLDLVRAFESSKNLHGIHVEFASVASSLPFMTSLEELRVEISNQNDLLWLAYAVFHPRTRETPWCRLEVRIADLPTWQRGHRRSQRPSIDWTAWSTVAHARSQHAILKQLLFTSGESVVAESNEAQSLEWTTATVIATRARLYSWFDRSRRLTTLSTGDNVEICGGTLTDSEAESDMVAVIVPGYGLGWVDPTHLSPFRQEEYAAVPTSSITSLALDDTGISTVEQEHALRLLGGSLRHLRTTGPTWFQRPDLRSLIPHVELMSNCRYSPALAQGDVQLLPNVKALELHCAGDKITECTDWIARYGHFPALQELCVRLEIDLAEVDFVLGDDVMALLARKHSLRCVTVLLTFERDLPLSDALMTHQRVESSYSSAGQRKRAFLSVLREPWTTRPASAVAHFDARILRVIFDFIGPSLDHLAVGVVMQRSLDAMLWRGEAETRGDAWFDQ